MKKLKGYAHMFKGVSGAKNNGVKWIKHDTEDKNAKACHKKPVKL